MEEYQEETRATFQTIDQFLMSKDFAIKDDLLVSLEHLQVRTFENISFTDLEQSTLYEGAENNVLIIIDLKCTVYISYLIQKCSSWYFVCLHLIDSVE